jgi:hypothetical protein
LEGKKGRCLFSLDLDEMDENYLSISSQYQKSFGHFMTSEVDDTFGKGLVAMQWRKR